MMKIATARLRLREFREDDFAALREIEGDPEILRYRSRKNISEEDTRKFLRDCQHLQFTLGRMNYPWAIVLRKEKNPVGQVGLTRIPEPTGEAFLWYSLNRRYWGRGIMTEALAAVLEYGFDHLGLSTIHADCHAENRASWRVMERAGLRRLDTRRVENLRGGTYIEYHYALTRAEWATTSTSQQLTE